MRPAERERGAALLTVLLLVAAIAVMAAASLEKLRLATRLSGNAVQAEQARSYAEAAEALALAKVDQLLGPNPPRVTLAGDWSGHPFPLPLPGGEAVARVTDGANCFNLNGLVTQVAPGVYASQGSQRFIFARLMRLLGVPAAVAEQVAAGASDWIDTDQDVQANGAEDAAYLGQQPAYRTAGTLMTDPSELRAVAGMTPELYARLRPWLCALPVAAPAPINIDTLAPEQAPLLAALGPETLTVDAAQVALRKRPAEGWADAGGFWTAANSSGGGGAGVLSRWFTLRIDVTVGRTVVTERALIDATALPARLVARQWGEDL
ncbi:type II secretion system minor pseudopilin GspK [uncultured Sphingomonas sp.]|uniref:type II secretion system minor pseudopilin GspK n=1 Tax=uncultured Sphingomonas sp. TaxID=158754 RepID=UPI0035CBA7E9